MEWNKSYIVKDAINMLSRIRAGKSEYTNSFQPELLGDVVRVMLDCPERPADFNFYIHPPLHEYNQICLTSGGADSTIAWYYAGKPHGLYIDIGQPYAAKEFKALSNLDINFDYIDMRGCHVGDVHWKHIIPGRNFLFLCVAAEMLKDDGTIWFAVVEGEGANSGKGDKSLEFITLFRDWYYACTGRAINIEMMLNNTKAGWLKWFAESNDISIIRNHTVTCFDAAQGQCGKCQACLRKYLSFISIGLDIREDFAVHPMYGANQYVEKYRVELHKALDNNDFSHYSRRRCREDLDALYDAHKLFAQIMLS